MSARCPTVSNQLRCPMVTPQADLLTYYNIQDPILSWMGSLLENRRDAAATVNQRARTYAPHTGRFTQEDPIGLGGGLNAYGFVNGDPVNYSDPFGLCPDPSKPWCSSPGYAVLRFFGVSDATADKIGGIFYGGAMIAGSAGAGEGVRGIGGAVGTAAAASDNAALVVRGGSNNPEAITKGAESIDEAGNVQGVSVNSAEGASVEDLAQGIPHSRIGVTTRGAIREAGGQIAPDATVTNPNHCKVSCISAANLSELLNPTIPNPAKP
jgi:RHS repeat-associated protein